MYCEIHGLVNGKVSVSEGRRWPNVGDVDILDESVLIDWMRRCGCLVRVYVLPKEAECVAGVEHEDVRGCVIEPGLTANASMGVAVVPSARVLPRSLPICPVILFEGCGIFGIPTETMLVIGTLRRPDRPQ